MIVFGEIRKLKEPQIEFAIMIPWQVLDEENNLEAHRRDKSFCMLIRYVRKERQ